MNRLRWFLLACGIFLLSDATACVPRITAVAAARETTPEVRPADGWEAVTLPDIWTVRWPDHGEGSDVAAVWYRVDWERGCDDANAEAVGLGIDGIVMAGALYLNDDLLWRDVATSEPLSTGWNLPRWWALPASALRAGANTLWIRTVSPHELASGLGALRLGAVADVEARHADLTWRQRTAYLLAASMSGVVGSIFLVVWILRRRERAYGWYALMSLCWTSYLATLLNTHPWPWPFDSTLAMSRLNLVLLAAYVLCFCLFTFRFGEQAFPRLERALYGLTGLCAAAMIAAPRAVLQPVSMTVLLVVALVFFANCVQFQWHAWRPRRNGRPVARDVQHLLLALCWLLFLVVGIHDLLAVIRAWSVHATWSPMTAPIAAVFMALLLGGRLAAGMRRIERFNQELEERVAAARSELADALEREHAQAVANARLQERVQLAHDLHDGLGGSLVRGMALVEQARRTRQPLPSDRVLSLLKLLRDDLRQVIDHGSSTGATVPETPQSWAAPLRHRFMRIFEAMDIASEWQFDADWRESPSALQCLGLTRIMEEALSNVIKHSQARHVRVECTQPEGGGLAVQIADDGVGFDVAAVRRTGLSVGTRSMAARAERIGARFEVESGERGTVVRVTLPPTG